MEGLARRQRGAVELIVFWSMVAVLFVAMVCGGIDVGIVGFLFALSSRGRPLSEIQ